MNKAAQQSRAEILRKSAAAKQPPSKPTAAIKQRKAVSTDHRPIDPRVDTRLSPPAAPSPAPASPAPTTPFALPPTAPIPILSFRARTGSTIGRLVLTTHGLSFHRSAPALASPAHPPILWTRPFSDLVELRKAESTGAALLLRLVPSQTLIIRWLDDTETQLRGMPRRDEAFNSIVGFSGARWMELDPVPEMREEGGKGATEQDVGSGEGVGRDGGVNEGGFGAERDGEGDAGLMDVLKGVGRRIRDGKREG